MHLVRSFGLALLSLALLTTACDDPFAGRFDPVVFTDTIGLAVATAEDSNIPPALDVTSAGGLIRGGRFPERASDAGAWDLMIGRRSSELVFLPPTAVGIESRAGISRVVEGQTFDGLRDASGIRFVTDSAVVVQLGALYVVRSREFAYGFQRCLQYSKLQPLVVDAATGTVSLQVATNENCFDTRLANLGS